MHEHIRSFSEAILLLVPAACLELCSCSWLQGNTVANRSVRYVRHSWHMNNQDPHAMHFSQVICATALALGLSRSWHQTPLVCCSSGHGGNAGRLVAQRYRPANAGYATNSAQCETHWIL